jgi:AraC family transcriptional regulator of adaptative response / DNA-3-methyladenine glycosylase II
MDLDRSVCDRARHSRDARFDGRFFIGVTTTGIYCRPICPARSPKDENVIYFPTAAAAEAAGFRPCLRCRPEASPGTPAWVGTSGVVSRALRLIGEGALRGASGSDADDRLIVDAGVDDLAGRVGVTARHLRRLFLKHLGATPLEVALTRRVHFAKRLLDETSLPVQQVAFASGFGSVRRFNGQIQRTFSRTPTELRRLRRHVDSAPDCYRFRLAYRPPYDWQAMIAFLAARATAGVESVDGLHYRRTITIGGRAGTIDVAPSESKPALVLDVRFPEPSALLTIVERVRRMFDLSADPAAIREHLASDRLLKCALDAHPGVRIPGAWDGFELAVRAILGQQVSVQGATTIAGRMAAAFGAPIETDRGVDRLFPDPERLLDAPLERVGIMPARAETIRRLAKAVASGTMHLSPDGDSATIGSALTALPGIGPWTASYVAMRALGEPDAFPAGDLVLRRVAGNLTTGELERRSQAWRPWRAYAVMLLWRTAQQPQTLSGGRHVVSPQSLDGRRRGGRRVDGRGARAASSVGRPG